MPTLPLQDASTLFSRAVALQDRGDLEGAIASYRAAAALAPDHAPTYCNLGAALKAQNQLADAIASYTQALRLAPNDPQTHNNLGNAYKAQAKLDCAIASFRQAIALDAQFATAHWNLALALLLAGLLPEGLAQYEYRFTGGGDAEFKQSRHILAWLSDLPRWNGADLQGQTLLVWTEQGQGDSLMMMRYLPHLAARGVGRVVVLCEASLVRVMECMPGVDRVVPKRKKPALDGIHLHCPLLSLPHIFGTQLDSIPADVPYLPLPPPLAAGWAARLGGTRLLRVGLVWAGGPALQANRQRSLALADFEPLLGLEGVHYLSLQKGEPAQQLQASHHAIDDWMDDCTDFLDTATLIHNLDLVISVDTAVAHLAGALGKPVWLLNRFESEWRWMHHRSDSPWYPSLRQFRQTEAGNWAPVIASVRAALRVLAADGPHGN